MDEKKELTSFTIEKTGPYQFKILFYDGTPLTMTFLVPDAHDPHDLDKGLTLEVFSKILKEVILYSARSLSIFWTPDGFKWETKAPKSVDDLFPRDN